LLPALITVSNELGLARYPTVPNIAKSKRIQPILWKPADIGIDATASEGQTMLKLLGLFEPTFEGTCEMVQGETIQELGENLALRLRQERIL